MTIMNTKYQLFPPGNHRSKNSYRSIHIFKKHFIAGLFSVDQYFHLQLWDSIPQQATIRLNLLQQSIIHPHMSAYAYLYGKMDYNHAPLDPPGTKVVIHNRPVDRYSWETNGEPGCYIVPAM